MTVLKLGRATRLNKLFVCNGPPSAIGLWGGLIPRLNAPVLASRRLHVVLDRFDHLFRHVVHVEAFGFGAHPRHDGYIVDP